MGKTCEKCKATKAVSELINAAGRSDLERVEALLTEADDGSKLANSAREDGMKPIHAAVMKPNAIEVLDALIRAGADPQAKTGDGKLWFTPLGMALASHRLENMEFLLAECGVDTNLPSQRGGVRPLHLAVRAKSPLNFVKCLLDHGASVNVEDDGGQTPVHRMAEFGDDDFDPAVLRLLLQQLDKEGPPSKYRVGMTPLYFALFKERFRMFQTILDHGVADLEAKDPQGRTCLGLAALSHVRAKRDNKSPELVMATLDAVKALCRAGADVFRTNTDIPTWIVKTYRPGDWQLIEILLESSPPSAERALTLLESTMAIHNSTSDNWLKDGMETVFGTVVRAWSAAEGRPLQPSLTSDFVLGVCVIRGNCRLLEIFLAESGMDPNVTVDLSRQQWATPTPTPNQEASWRAVDHGADGPMGLVHLAVINSRPSAGEASGAIESLRWLVANKKVNLKARDAMGRTALELAVSLGSNRASKIIKQSTRRTNKGRGGRNNLNTSTQS